MTRLGEIIEVPVGHLLKAAQERAEDLGVLPGSTRGMAAAQVGCLGELVGMEHLTNSGVQFKEVYSTSHDLTFELAGEVKTLEIKTKERTAPPRENYDCTTPNYNKDHQRPDYYLFISLLSTGGDSITRFTKAYILGTIGRAGFDANATLWKPSDTDWSNGWRPTIACWNVPVLALTPPKRKGEQE